MENKIKVGLVSFTENRDVDLVNETIKYEREQHEILKKKLIDDGFYVFDFFVKSTSDVIYVSNSLLSSGIDCLIIGAWKWTETALAVRLVKELSRPTLLFGKSDDNHTALGCIAAIGASLWEIASPKEMLTHERILDDYEEVVSWINGAGSWKKIQNQSILLWGGSYSLKMDHLQDDVSHLKSFLIGDILNESEYILIKKAEEILEVGNERIEKFIKWLVDNKCKIIFDEKMLTQKSFRKQIALYLASRDRLKELEDENVVGVSIHCQPALSIYYGVTGCFLPAFLPFGMDAEGKQDIISTVCEGDIKGLLTSVILQNISREQPTGFGDIRTLSNGDTDLLFIGNCGGASIFYANNSLKDSETLPHVKICAQCQGKAGGSVGYCGKKMKGKVTVARLIRQNGEYLMQFGVGNSVEVTDDMKEKLEWGKDWPQIAIDLNMKVSQMVKILGSNHFSLVFGNFSKEIKYFCKQANIPFMEINHE